MEIISKKALNHEDTELRLGLPGTDNGSEKSSSRTNKRAFTEMSEESTSGVKECDRHVNPPAKVQAIGWPPIRSYRRNSLQTMKEKVENSGMYVKVSMDGAAYLRKIDLNLYEGYSELLKALEDMFNFKLGEYFKREGYNGSEYEPTYEDKDGDWMLVGDVPWEMFVTSCKRLRIVRAS